jgi:hypothetical protein
VIGLVVAIVPTAVFRLMRLPAGADETLPAHYLAGDDGSAVEPVPVPTAAAGTADRPTRPASRRGNR